MKPLILLIFAIIVYVFTNGCKNDNEENLYPVKDCDLTNVTYSKTVTDIIKSNCYKCHSNSNQEHDVNLEGYNNISIYANNGNLSGVINTKDGFPQMPPDNKLPDCKISQINKWIEDGAQNN